MNTQLQENCDRLVENKNKLKEVFPLNDGSVQLITAALLSCMGKDIPQERLNECKEILKDNASLFSEYRGNAMMPLIAYMAAGDDPERLLERIKKVYESLTRLFGSTHKLMAALSIVDRTKDGEEEAAAVRMNEIKQTLKEKYHWAARAELMPYLALMATSGKDVETITKEAAQCLEQLELEHLSKAEKEALACVLAMDKEPASDKCRKVSEQGKLLKMDKFRLFQAPDRILLGILPRSEEGIEKIAAMIEEIDTYLKGKKGCSWLTVDPDIRKSVAMLVASLSDGRKEDYQADVLLDAAIRDIIETQTMLMAALVAGSASI